MLKLIRNLLISAALLAPGIASAACFTGPSYTTLTGKDASSATQTMQMWSSTNLLPVPLMHGWLTGGTFAPLELDANCSLEVNVITSALPAGAATSALQNTINTILGSPFQAGGSIGNTGFQLTGGTGATAAGVDGANNLQVTPIGSNVFYDAFETGFDTTTRWQSPTSAGGGVGEAWTAGQITLGTGTTANGYSYVQSRPTFVPVPPGWNVFEDGLAFPASIPANTEAFWGFGTSPATPTAAIPITEGCGFEILPANQHLAAVCFAGSTRATITDLTTAGTAPTDGNVHVYKLYFRGDYYWYVIDGVIVAKQTNGANGPNVNTQPLKIATNAGTTNPGSSLTLTVAGTWVGDTTGEHNKLCDSANPFNCAAVSGRGAELIDASVSGVSTNPTSTLTMTSATTAYTSGQLIATSATAGSVVVPSFAIANSAGGAAIYRVRLDTNDTTSTAWGGQTINMDLWTTAPTFTNGDRGTYSPATGTGAHLALFVCSVSSEYGDGAYAECIPSQGAAFALVKLGSGTAIYWTMTASTGSGVTGASKVWTATPEVGN